MTAKLPAQHTAAARSSTVMSESAPSKEKVKILAVDDQPDNLLSVEAVLESLGEELVTALSGREALRHLLEQDFALILLDVMMPEMDGFETAELIRRRERSRDTPIIFLTALGKSEEHLFRGYDVGAVDYIFKPIVPEVLRSKVSVFVELNRKTTLLKKHTELLQAKNAELSALNSELEAFSYTVSHDLRGPLNRMAGFSQALLESSSDKLDERGRLYVNRIHSSADRMCQLVDDLLGLARFTRAEMVHEPVNLSAIAEGIAADLRSRQEDRDVKFVIADGVTVSGDSPLLTVVLTNLLENAWKFTSKQSDACIELGVQMHLGKPVYFVRDNGVGFDMTLSHKLFTAFQRLHASSEFDGTGIGLATVERIIKRHGGNIWAESEVGRGATFYFTL